MPPPLLQLQDISLSFGVMPLLSGATLAVAAGDRICLVGRNGSGKSTLLRIAAGLVQADTGERLAHPGATIQYLPQEPDLAGFGTTLAYVEAGFDSATADGRHRALYLLKELGLSGDEDPASLSGGEARRAALARALAPSPDILLLDEPTNHLDLPGIEWLERELAGMRAGIVLVSHDRRLLERFSRSTVWLDRGVTRVLDEGFSAFEALGGARLEAAQPDLSGRLVAAAEGISKAYGDHLVVRNFSMRVMRGDRVGIVGPNGAGKTTLLNLLTGALPPDAGEVRLGTNLVQVTLDQRRENLDPEQSLAEALTRGSGDTVTVGGQSRHVIGYMKDFLFRPEQARTPVGVLSGGERARLTLARAFARPCNLLVLDEPTNDLDLETLDLLQEQLAEHPGTVRLVSHDRDFLDRVVTSTIATDGNGRWVEYAGGYTDMLAQRAEESRGSPPPKTRNTKRSRPGTQTSELPGSPPRRMNFNDRRALHLLPARIAALEARITELNAVLADLDLYRRDPARFRDTTDALAVTRDELAAAEDQWLRLEMLREEIEGIEPKE